MSVHRLHKSEMAAKLIELGLASISVKRQKKGTLTMEQHAFDATSILLEIGSLRPSETCTMFTAHVADGPSPSCLTRRLAQRSDNSRPNSRPNSRSPRRSVAQLSLLSLAVITHYQ